MRLGPFCPALAGCLALVACGSPPPPTVLVPPPLVVPVEASRASPIGTDPEAQHALVTDTETPSEKALQGWNKQSQCPDYDYFPDGGIQSLWCHRPARITIAAIRTLAGVDIWMSGPHPKEDLALSEPNTFGHYNPAFVRWLVDHAGPSPRESAARRATQASYDANLKPLAEIFWATLGKARRERECFDREKTAYGDAITRKKLPKDYYERWFYFMNSHFCDKPKKSESWLMSNGLDGGVSGNVTKTVVGFWLRRALDGTMETFAEGLQKVIASYQPELLQEPTR
jgi:hypothetical protein